MTNFNPIFGKRAAKKAADCDRGNSPLQALRPAPPTPSSQVPPPSLPYLPCARALSATMDQETTLSSFPETDGIPSTSNSSISVCYEMEEEDLAPSSSEAFESTSPPPIPIPSFDSRPRGPTSSVLWCELSQLARRLAQLKFRMQQVPEGPQRARLVAQFETLSQTKRAIKHMLGPAPMRVTEPYSPRIMSRPR